MTKKYFYLEKDAPPTVANFSVDAAQILEDKIRMYSQKDKTGNNSKILFAYQDALRIIRKLEGIYLEKEQKGH